MHLQPPHFSLINLLAKQSRLLVHLLALHPINRGVKVRIGKLSIQRRLFLIPLAQLAFKLLDFFDQGPALGQQCLPIGLGIRTLSQSFGFLGDRIGLRSFFGTALSGQP